MSSLKSVERTANGFAVGESVVIDLGEDEATGLASTGYGQIKSIVKKKVKDGNNVRIAWYYKPEDLQSGRKGFHGKKELLASDHEDSVPDGSILERVNVHSLEAFEGLSVVGKYDFFSRFFFQQTTGSFIPDQVPVLCVCRLPYNPDHEMIGCDGCGEWYHIACLDEQASFEVENKGGAEVLCSKCAMNRVKQDPDSPVPSPVATEDMSE